MAEEKELHPKMQALLREAEEAYQIFLARMAELEEERRRVYKDGFATIDAKKIALLKKNLST